MRTASYPISSFTWLYVPAIASDPERGRAVADHLKLVYTGGKRITGGAGYATLPVLAKVAVKASTVR
jgi:ABC-type phosphate transport system substrate-binding protein